MAEPPVPDDSSIDIFFSYVSDNTRTIEEVLRDAKFGNAINGTIFERKDAKVKSLAESLEELIGSCEIFVAYISEAYSADKTAQLEFDTALKLIAQSSPTRKLRELAFVILDRKGMDWWTRAKTRSEIAAWRRDPVPLDWVDYRGRPKSLRNSPDLFDEIQDWAKQLRKLLEEPQTQACQVTVLGHPTGDVAKETEDAQVELMKALQARNIATNAVPHGWSEQDPGSCPGLKIEQSPPSVFVQPVNITTAAFCLDFPDNLTKQITRAAGGAGDGLREHAIQACNKVFWLPAGLRLARFERKAAEQRGSPPQNPAYCTGSAVDLGDWIVRLLGGFVGTEPPLLFCELLPYEELRRLKRNVIREDLIPKASIPLQDRYVPPQLEDQYFIGEAEFDQRIKDLFRYDCGIFALHNFGTEIDNVGELPHLFQARIRFYDKKLRDFVRAEGISLDRIIRLGIVATTMPSGHQYSYVRKTDNTLAQWRFVAVSLEHGREPHVIDKHIEALKVDLEGVITRRNAAREAS